MLVSIVVPACAAEATIARAVASLAAQTWPDWEAVVVADDGADYAAVLARAGLADRRLRFVSTGGVRTSCHHARNVGLAAVTGDIVGHLDADDVFAPERLAVLAPLAERHGAAVDNTAVVADDTGALLYRAFGDLAAPIELGLGDLLALSVPLFPLVRRDHAEPRLPGIEFAEDVVANLRLIDRLGRLRVVPRTLMEYRVVGGSICHSDDSVAQFDRAYAALIERVTRGDGLGLLPASRAVARDGLAAKRALNAAFGAAQREDPSLNFQSYVAGLRRS